jgi:hypothetical protein
MRPKTQRASLLVVRDTRADEHFRRMDLRREFDWNLYIAQRNAHGRFISNDPDVSLNAIKQVIP